MDRIWDTYKYPLKPLMTLCQNKVIQGHEVKKLKLKFWVRLVWCRLLSQFFVNNAKNDTGTLFEGPKWDKIWKSKNAKILINNAKVAI